VRGRRPRRAAAEPAERRSAAAAVERAGAATARRTTAAAIPGGSAARRGACGARASSSCSSRWRGDFLGDNAPAVRRDPSLCLPRVLTAFAFCARRTAARARDGGSHPLRSQDFFHGIPTGGGGSSSEDEPDSNEDTDGREGPFGDSWRLFGAADTSAAASAPNGNRHGTFNAAATPVSSAATDVPTTTKRGH
jgi:hypothetical protein